MAIAAAGVTTLMLTGTNGEGPLLPSDGVRAGLHDLLGRDVAPAGS
jgi:hypothetical protein